MSFFSVVIPLYNKAHTIADTLVALRRQSFPDYELIVIDDGSSDASSRIVEELGDKNTRLIRQENAGPAVARNTGIGEARGTWIAFLDADDLWHPDHLRELWSLTQRFPEAGLVGSAFIPVASADEFARISKMSGGSAEQNLISFFREVGEGRPPFCASSAAAPRSLLRRVGGFSDLRIGEDRELWSRLALDHPVAASRRITAGYLSATGGIMDNAAARWDGQIFDSAADIAPACAVVEKAYATATTDRRREFDAFLDRYVGYVVSASIVRGDVAALRRLSALYRSRPRMKALLYLAAARLPMPLAQFVFRIRRLLVGMRR